ILYFVNVPNCDIVLSATLRLPYMVAELVWRAKMANHGTLPETFVKEFVDKGLSDKCFNEKLRVFSAFYHDWMAKFDGVLTPEEKARKQLSSGTFGAYLQGQDPHTVLQQKCTLASLIAFFEKHQFEVEGLTADEFVEAELTRCI